MNEAERPIIRPSSEYSAAYPILDIDEIDKRENYLKASRMHVEQSGFVAIVRQQALVLKGRILENELLYSEDRPEQLLVEDSFFCALVWDEANMGGGEYLGKALIVEGFANGSIIIHGNLIGSTILRKEEWFNDPSLQSRALEKAKKNPTTISTVIDTTEE